ncbi:MAG TPA: TetR/AcrR family transcriptional regulator [Acidimicrobiia bacterium]|nr:TetR/AcrR family transcriptional regulator [Acidimicrobiia bacterium]
MSTTAALPRVPGRRDEILGIAGELFAERGFTATTVREIADAAGILSGSLYHHFDSKEAMADELVREVLDRVLAAYRRIAAGALGPEPALRALVREAFGAIATDRATVALLVNEWNLFTQVPRFGYLRVLEQETERLWVGVLEHGAAVGVFRADLDARMLYRMLRDAIWVSVRWYRADGPVGPDQLADRYVDVLLTGVRSRP